MKTLIIVIVALFATTANAQSIVYVVPIPGPDIEHRHIRIDRPYFNGHTGLSTRYARREPVRAVRNRGETVLFDNPYATEIIERRQDQRKQANANMREWYCVTSRTIGKLVYQGARK